MTPNLANWLARCVQHWQDVRFPQGTGALDPETRRGLERLANTGYATGYEPLKAQVGVVHP